MFHMILYINHVHASYIMFMYHSIMQSNFGKTTPEVNDMNNAL